MHGYIHDIENAHADKLYKQFLNKSIHECRKVWNKINSFLRILIESVVTDRISGLD